MSLTKRPGPMMGGSAPTVSLISQALDIQVTASHAPTPGTRAVNDRLLLLFTTGANIDSVSNYTDRGSSIGNPTGWFSRTATNDASDTPTIALASSQQIRSVIAAIRSLGTTLTFSNDQALVGGSGNCPTATAPGAATDVLLVLASQSGGSNPPTIGTPSGFTPLGSSTHTNGSLRTRCSVFSRVVSAGATGTTPVTYTLDGGASDGGFSNTARVLVSA